MRCLLLAMLLGACAMSANAQLIVAHRGASHTAPENTLAAFRLAWEEGADGIEGDFYLSADNQIVCIHDKDTERTAGKKLIVEESSLEQLRALDVGSWKDAKYKGEKIPTLAEVLETVPEGKRMIIELKSGPEIVEPLQKVLADTDVPKDKMLIIAFDADTVLLCKRKMPEIKVHWLTGYKKSQFGAWNPSLAKVVQTLRASGADGLGSNGKPDVFNEDFILRLKSAGLGEFHVWTIDDPKVAKFYIDQGAYGITTNRPGWLRKELGEALEKPAGS
ncbi:glycerophosphodiester phosphodiesterase [Aeoliella sp. ICT_H6.2]|uniref:Glycerophosphodiester phosphodiesterase n=1 Tax=Aeoliella straminimaris TaxID=2954799 RepID=A0A9X2FA19_9BACT|nr:glycerophosphodiester phosphodiesterase [Aeoliella straminimaris]MCO6042484.1 glycerophosphodiester phosphodiesterase [Aeoliella straminimaris]